MLYLKKKQFNLFQIKSKSAYQIKDFFFPSPKNPGQTDWFVTHLYFLFLFCLFCFYKFYRLSLKKLHHNHFFSFK